MQNRSDTIDRREQNSISLNSIQEEGAKALKQKLCQIQASPVDYENKLLAAEI